MPADNNDKIFGEGRLEEAHSALRKETLPALASAYDEAGPATLLTLAFILADIWLESGFTTNEWREIIDIFDSEREALRAR